MDDKPKDNADQQEVTDQTTQASLPPSSNKSEPSVSVAESAVKHGIQRPSAANIPV